MRSMSPRPERNAGWSRGSVRPPPAASGSAFWGPLGGAVRSAIKGITPYPPARGGATLERVGRRWESDRTSDGARPDQYGCRVAATTISINVKPRRYLTNANLTDYNPTPRRGVAYHPSGAARSGSSKAPRSAAASRAPPACPGHRPARRRGRVLEQQHRHDDRSRQQRRHGDQPGFHRQRRPTLRGRIRRDARLLDQPRGPLDRPREPGRHGRQPELRHRRR